MNKYFGSEVLQFITSVLGTGMWCPQGLSLPFSLYRSEGVRNSAQIEDLLGLELVTLQNHLRTIDFFNSRR